MRRYAVSAVVFILKFTAFLGDVDRLLHRGGDLFAKHHDLSVHVSRGPPHRLNEARARAQKALLIGIHDRDKAYFGQIEPLAEQIYTD